MDGGGWYREEEGGRCRGPVTGGGLLWLLVTSERHRVGDAEAGSSVPDLPHLVWCNTGAWPPRCLCLVHYSGWTGSSHGRGLSPAPGPCRSPWAGVRTVLHCRLLIICALVLHLQNGILLPSVSRHLRSLK